MFPFVRRFFLALVLSTICCCAHRVDTASAVRLEVAKVEDTKAAQETVTHEVDAPGRVTTTVEEYEHGAPQEEAAEAPAGGVPLLQGAQGRAGGEGVTKPPERAPEAAAGRLIRRTVIVKDFGPVTKDTRVEAAAATETHEVAHLDAKATTHTETHVGPSPWLWLGIGSALVVAGLAWKFKWLL